MITGTVVAGVGAVSFADTRTDDPDNAAEPTPKGSVAASDTARGHSSEERSQVIAVVRALRSNLRDVERALQKFETGAYGRCERCGEPIAVERLEALPWALLGIDCKQRGESG